LSRAGAASLASGPMRPRAAAALKRVATSGSFSAIGQPGHRAAGRGAGLAEDDGAVPERARVGVVEQLDRRLDRRQRTVMPSALAGLLPGPRRGVLVGNEGGQGADRGGADTPDGVGQACVDGPGLHQLHEGAHRVLRVGAEPAQGDEGGGMGARGLDRLQERGHHLVGLGVGRVEGDGGPDPRQRVVVLEEGLEPVGGLLRRRPDTLHEAERLQPQRPVLAPQRLDQHRRHVRGVTGQPPDGLGSRQSGARVIVGEALAQGRQGLLGRAGGGPPQEVARGPADGGVLVAEGLTSGGPASSPAWYRARRTRPAVSPSASGSRSRRAGTAWAAAGPTWTTARSASRRTAGSGARKPSASTAVNLVRLVTDLPQGHRGPDPDKRPARP